MTTQTKSKHTLGIWNARIIDDSKQIVGTKEATVATIYRNLGSPVTQEMHGQGDANARLISAAPELLEALKEIAEKASLYCDNASFAISTNVACQSHLGHDMINYAHIADLATKAIQKAEGK